MPKLGDKEGNIMFLPSSKTPYYVIVQVFKFDSIRQEPYWVTIRARSFKDKNQAESFLERNLK